MLPHRVGPTHAVSAMRPSSPWGRNPSRPLRTAGSALGKRCADGQRPMSSAPDPYEAAHDSTARLCSHGRPGPPRPLRIARARLLSAGWPALARHRLARARLLPSGRRACLASPRPGDAPARRPARAHVALPGCPHQRIVRDRLMPSFFILDRSVLGLTCSSSAAPPRPAGRPSPPGPAPRPRRQPRSVGPWAEAPPARPRPGKFAGHGTSYRTPRGIL